MQTYQSLIQKLDTFIRKYYSNQLLKGFLLFVIVSVAIYLLLVLGEYFFYWTSVVKIPLLLSLGLVAVWALVKNIIFPLLRMQQLGKRINHEQAAQIIGAHFPNVDDKIVNVLQLQTLKSNVAIDTSLLEASIEQKSNQLISLPFTQAIDTAKTKRFWPWFIGSASLLIIAALIVPQVFQSATGRLLQPTTNFIPPAPFIFEIDSQSKHAVLWQSHDIVVQVKGEKLPEEVAINIDGVSVAMQPIGDFKFKYTLPKVHQAHIFYFEAVGYRSEEYQLQVDFLPVIDAIKVQLIYPKHIQKQHEILQVFSDLQVPEGTWIHWELQTQYTDGIVVIMDSTQVLATNKDQGKYSWEKQLTSNASFQLLIKGNQPHLTDTFTYHIEVIKDLAPTLSIETKRDSVIGDQIVFSGIATDDYGIQQVAFVYELTNEQGKTIHTQVKNLPIDAALSTKIQYYIDAATIPRPHNENVRMFIRVCDNDVINGGKCVTSAPIYLNDHKKSTSLTDPSSLQENAAKLQQSLTASKEQQKAMQQDMEDLKSKMLDTKTMDWQQQQQLDHLAENQQELQQKMEAVRKRLEEQQKKVEQMGLSAELQEKQDDVKKQLDQIIDKDLQEQLKKLEELRQQKNPQQAFEQVQKMEQQNKLFQMNMERVQALIQKLELQLSMELMAEKIEEFVAKEEAILEQTEEGQLGEKSASNQEKVRQDFDKAMEKALKEMRDKELQAKDKEGTSSAMEQEQNEVQDAMEESADQLKNGQQNSAQQKQQQAINKMKKMAQKLQQQSGGLEMEQLDIDIKATRQLLTNLLRYSFDQEQLINKVRQTPTSSQAFVDLNKEQARLAANAKMMKDSLFSLSKRLFKIASNVNKETTELELNIKNAIAHLQDRQSGSAQVRQQYAMTNANNLALILNNLLENLMQDMQEASGAGGESEDGKEGNPGQSKGKGKGKGKGQGNGEGAGDQLKDIITKQQQLGQGMQKGSGQGQGSQRQNGQGENGQGGQQGQSGGQGGSNSGGSESGEYGDAKELARMAREQAQLRQQLQQLNSILNTNGIKGLSKQMQELQSLMDKNETDLVNKRLSRALLMRQQEIMSKLLETEKAVREQEQDDKRQGNTAKEVERPIPAELKQFMKEQDVLYEQYKTQAPEWKPFYKKLNDQYLQKVK